MNIIWVLAGNTIRSMLRKKDFYVFFILLLLLLFLLWSETFFGIQDIVRYIKDMGYFFSCFFSVIIAIVFSARQVPDEIADKTIYPLIAKPVSRAHLLLGRYTGSLLASSLAFTLFYILYTGVVILKAGSLDPVVAVQAWIFGICSLGIVCAVSMFLSLCLTLSAAVTMSFLLYFFIMWFSTTIRKMIISAEGIKIFFTNALYYIMPHYEFFDLRVRIAHSWEAVPVSIFTAAVMYAVIYSSMILYFCHLRLKKKIL